jgi:hypothetical protein
MLRVSAGAGIDLAIGVAALRSKDREQDLVSSLVSCPRNSRRMVAIKNGRGDF